MLCIRPISLYFQSEKKLFFYVTLRTWSFSMVGSTLDLALDKSKNMSTKHEKLRQQKVTKNIPNVFVCWNFKGTTPYFSLKAHSTKKQEKLLKARFLVPRTIISVPDLLLER